MIHLSNLKEFSTTKLAAIFIAIGGLFVMKGCTLFMYEEELPDVLKKENPFYE
ncbi:hypothetical protein [Metalysinibacillus jejuensis]|uniref:hypothetical protein n=1 Tax=Metalysinibacillus jejuensis TaxID=914327 RepID=UPI00137B65BE|nr:hypothetical protein [Metalysinibacillus jejuensis]